MNVTAWHGEGAVHLAGYQINDRYAPACGTQHHNVGGRVMSELYPTDKDVTCKKCLKKAAKASKPTQPVVSEPVQQNEEPTGIDTLRSLLSLKM